MLSSHHSWKSHQMNVLQHSWALHSKIVSLTIALQLTKRLHLGHTLPETSVSTATFSTWWWHTCDYDLRQRTCRLKQQRHDALLPHPFAPWQSSIQETIHVLCAHSLEHEGDFHTRLFESHGWLLQIFVDMTEQLVLAKDVFSVSEVKMVFGNSVQLQESAAC